MDKMLPLFAYGASILPEYAVRMQVWFPGQDAGGGEQDSRNPRAWLRQCFTMNDFSSWCMLTEVLMEWLVYSKYALPTQHPPEIDLFALKMQVAHSSKTKAQTFTTQCEKQKKKHNYLKTMAIKSDVLYLNWTAGSENWKRKLWIQAPIFTSYNVSPDNLNVHRSILNPASVMFCFSFSLQPVIHMTTGTVMSHVSHFVYI